MLTSLHLVQHAGVSERINRIKGAFKKRKRTKKKRISTCWQRMGDYIAVDNKKLVIYNDDDPNSFAPKICDDISLQRSSISGVKTLTRRIIQFEGIEQGSSIMQS